MVPAITLPPALYQELLDAERQLTDAIPEMDKAEKCGIDCHKYREVLRVQLDTIQSLKANFAPPANLLGQ